MTTTLAPSPQFRQWDNNGNPLVNGQLFTYAAGTTTPQATFTDSTGLTQNANPVLLNGRGEAQVWLTPNLAYKFVLQDSSGNQIWAVDQVVNAQLLTLYGGADTGVANAYILNFVANFTSYTDGIFILWIPANANTGASTININGLGVIALVNQDGSALRAGQITPNQVSSILIKGGKALLVNNSVASSVLAVPGSAASPSISFASDPGSGWYFAGAGQIGLALDGNFGVISTALAAFTLTGVSGTVNFNARYYTNGLWVVLRLPQISGTSNSTSFGATTSAAALFPPTNIIQWIQMPAMEDNTAGIYSQVGTVQATGSPITNAATFTFYKGGSATGWTNTGTKGIADGSSSVNAITISYMLV